MQELSIRVLYLAVLFYAFVCAYLYFAQRSMLYFPTAERHLPQAESIALPAGDATLRIWARPLEGHGAVIYFGGNGEDVAASFNDFASAIPGRAIYLVNYRGYGGSTGTPSEAALFRDALAVYDWVRMRHSNTGHSNTGHSNTGHSNIAVIGSSLGSGVAVYLATERKVDRLVLVTPFDSIANVAQDKLRVFPVSILLRDKFDSLSRVQNVSAKTLILIADEDEMIPRARTDALVAKFPQGQAVVEVIRGATHNDISAYPAYLRLIGAFL